MAENDEKTPTFEEAMSALEKIVQAIESGQIGLEDSLSKYEQGMQLVKRCRGILENAEKRIELISQTSNGLTAAPMDPSALRSPTA